MRRRTVAIVSGSVVAALLIALFGALFLLSGTDWGREKVRGFALDKLRGVTHGLVNVGRIEGNLLSGARLVNVTITDSSGAPFVRADTVVADYSVRTLLAKHIELNNVRFVHPVIVLDRKTGGRWNWDRIFPHDTTPHPGAAPGFLSWVTLTNVTIVDGHLTMRSPWAPPDTLTGAQRDSAIRVSMGPLGRQNIYRVGNGFQRLSDFRDVFGTLPLLRLEDPNDRRQIIDVATLRMTAEPLKPPSVRVTDANGRFIVLGDSLYFSGVRASLASSRLSSINGRYNIMTNDLRLRLHGDTIATNDMLWIDPSIPQDGTGKLDFALDWVGKTSDYQARGASLAVANATMSGDLGVMVTDTLAFHNTDLKFAHLDTRTIQQLFPTIKSPRQGFLTGRMAATGGFGAMHLNGDVTFDDPQTGASRLIALGTVGASGGVLRADDFHVTLAPLRVALARSVSPSLPIGGTLTGTAVLNGSTSKRLSANGDLTHEDVTGKSRVAGSAIFASAAGARVPFINANLRMFPLSLATVGKFAPAAGLRGAVTGPVSLTGPMRNLAVSADLTTPDGGSIATRGTLDLASRVLSYDLVTNAHVFDASIVSSKAPSTSVTANVTVRGTGVDPATVNAVASANVLASQYDSIAVDSVLLRVRASNGVLTVDSLVAHAPHGYASVVGQVGLTTAHRGTLRYVASIDSLGQFARFVPGTSDTTSVPPRPGILARRLQVARADSLRVAQATEVERAVTGKRPPRLVVDTPGVIPRNRFAGSLQAQGTATGNVHTFDLAGTASGKKVVALGNSAEAFTAKYAWKTAFTPQSRVSADINATTVVTAGFDLDTVNLSTSYAKPNGTVDLIVHQDSNRVYTIGAKYVLNKDRNDLQLNNAQLRFDTTVYSTARPSLIHFGPAGIEIDKLALQTPTGRGIYVDGRIPTNGTADVHVDITQFDVANIIGLLESDIPARGLVSLDAHLQGTRAAPVVSGAFGLERFNYNGTNTPEVHGRLEYANETLKTNLEANREGGAPLLTGVGTVPINLALAGVTGSRIPRDRTIAATIQADSLPLDLIPQFPGVTSNFGGTAFARFTVAGTVNNPDVNGRISLSNGSVNVVPAGVTLTNLATNIRLIRDTIVIDSLVARSDGPIRLSGGIGVKSLAAPTFDLKLAARNAEVLDNAMGNLHANAALAVKGPFNSVELSGSARVLQGVVYIPESSGKTLVGAGDPALFAVSDSSLNQQLFPSQSPLLANLRMNVAIGVNRDVFVRSKEANVEVYSDGDLRVTVNNAKQSLAVDGVLLSDRGEYRFQSRRFQITHGSATFLNAESLNPLLQVTGEYDVQLPAQGLIAIQIVISGTLDRPKIALQSNAQPPISQTDLLSYLAFGRSSSSLLQQEGSSLTTGGTGGGNIVGKGAAFAAKQVSAAALGAVTDQVSGQAARSLGADFFNIAPADVSLDASSFLRGTQIEFGKYIQARTFVQLQVRPDPASLQRPGFQLVHRFDPASGYRIEASFEPRYLLTQPNLARDQAPVTTSAFGLFLVREWRY